MAAHADVDALLRSAASGAATDRPELMVALSRLEDHIHREEYDLFPMAHQARSTMSPGTGSTR